MQNLDVWGLGGGAVACWRFSVRTTDRCMQNLDVWGLGGGAVACWRFSVRTTDRCMQNLDVWGLGGGAVACWRFSVRTTDRCMQNLDVWGLGGRGAESWRLSVRTTDRCETGGFVDLGVFDVMDYVEVCHVTKRFGEDTALLDVNIAMERGRVYGISGNNGSGKTVLMKCICGFLPVTEGRICVGGKVIGVEIDFPESIGVIIETPGFLTNLTGMRNLEILAGLKGVISKREIREAILRAGLDPDLKKAVSKYSLGMRQRLGIAQAIMEDPEFLILDEPFNGLDKHGVADIRALILSLKEQGKTILLASHNSEDIRILCDKVFEMDGGRIREL